MQLFGEPGPGSVGFWADKSGCSSYGRVFIMRGNLLAVGIRLPTKPQRWWKDQEPEGTCPTNWTSHWTFLGRKGSLFLIRNQVLFSVLTWFQEAALSNLTVIQHFCALRRRMMLHCPWTHGDHPCSVTHCTWTSEQPWLHPTCGYSSCCKRYHSWTVGYKASDMLQQPKR